MLLPGNQQDAAAASSSPHAVPSFTSLQQQQQLQPDERYAIADATLMGACNTNGLCRLPLHERWS